MKTFEKMKICKTRAAGFTLMEIMIVVAIIGLLIGVAVPKFGKMRSDAQRTMCYSNLTQIDGAKEMWAAQEKRKNGDVPTSEQIGPYLKDGVPDCPGGGGEYNLGAVSTEDASCLYHGNKKTPQNE